MRFGKEGVYVKHHIIVGLRHFPRLDISPITLNRGRCKYRTNTLDGGSVRIPLLILLLGKSNNSDVAVILQ